MAFRKNQVNGPFVSVIVPVFNDEEALARCLEALERQTYPSDRYEVIVADNASDPPVALDTSRFPHARIVREPRRGSYVARNTGIDRAQGEVVAFTDSDCIPGETWLERGTARLLADPGCGLVAGRIEVFCRDPDHPTAAELYDCVLAFPQARYVEQGHFGATANVFTWRRVIDRVGGFDPALQSGGDSEWGKRVAAHGYGVVYEDTAVVAHPARRSFGEIRKKVVRVAGGLSALGYRSGSVRSFRASLHRVLRDERARGLARRSKLLLLFIAVKWVQAWSKLCPRDVGRRPGP